MELLVQTVINTLILAAVYILCALGFAFILNLLGVFNMAHGAIFMTTGYICYILVTRVGINQWLAFAISVVVAGLLGIVVERLCFRPFLGDFNRTTMICIAIAVSLTTGANLFLGTKVIAIPPFIKGTVGAPPYTVQTDRILIFAIGAAVLALVLAFVKWSRWGAQMQAITQNRVGAALQGIRFGRVAAVACFVGFLLAGVAGIFMGSYSNLSPFMGDLMLVKVLVVVILAGVGSFKGILAMGVILGALYSCLPLLLSGTVSDVVASGLVAVIILIRPQGFFGHE